MKSDSARNTAAREAALIVSLIAAYYKATQEAWATLRLRNANGEAVNKIM